MVELMLSLKELNKFKIVAYFLLLAVIFFLIGYSVKGVTIQKEIYTYNSTIEKECIVDNTSKIYNYTYYNTEIKNISNPMRSCSPFQAILDQMADLRAKDHDFTIQNKTNDLAFVLKRGNYDVKKYYYDASNKRYYYAQIIVYADADTGSLYLPKDYATVGINNGMVEYSGEI